MNNHHFYGHGKLLLTGEYFVLEGADALALPTKMGQSMHVTYKRSRSPKLYWKGVDSAQNIWFEAVFELWHFNILENDNELSRTLQKVLRQARVQNIHFLRDEVDTFVQTTLEFPLEWGLGSSSTLMYNIAQWAYISPFELQLKTFGGSGYDIACAQSNGPIIYSIKDDNPHWRGVDFEPAFSENIYFVYLNKKMNSKNAVSRYKSLEINNKKTIVNELNKLTKEILNVSNLSEFEFLIKEHEILVSKELKLLRAKEIYFSDYWGEVKSLGAWGGDFVLVTSSASLEKTKNYFKSRGFDIILGFSEMICSNGEQFKQSCKNLSDKISNDHRQKICEQY